MKRITLLNAIVVFLFLANLCFAQDDLRINFIDVGEGDAILIQAKNNNALIDTGNLLSGPKLVEFLKKNNAVKLKYLIITHPHPDHMAGAFFIVPQFAIGEIFDNGQALNKDEDIYRWYGQLVRQRANYRVLKTSDIIKLDDVILEVLSPDRPGFFSSPNANSLLIMLTYKNFRCLITGDFNNIGEKKLLEKNLNLKAQILKLGHHGFFDATSRAFLEAVSPAIAVISVDANNIRGAPSQSTLSLLQEKGIKIYRTDRDGNIIVSVDKNGKFSVITER